jgi:putative DNA primase/helicase
VNCANPAGIPYGWKGAGRVRQADETRTRSRRAFTLWRYADYIAPDCVAAEYFHARRIGWLAAKRFRDTVRWIPDALHPSGLKLPAIYCAVTDSNDAFRAVHRIFLKRERPEKFGAPASYGPISGHAIKLATMQQAINAGDLIVGEGLETTASACALLRLPGWCGVAAGNIAQCMTLPPEIRRIVLAVDRDRPGERAAEAAAKRWRAEGRTVRFLVPNTDGDDCNDILAGRPAANGR